MGLTSDDLLDKKWSEKDRQEIAIVLNRYKSNDIWANKIFKKIGILITSHQANRIYLKACLESHKKLGYWICLAYDGFVNPENDDDIDYNRFMPAKDTIQFADTFILSRWQDWGGVLYPYFWLLKFGANALQDFEYIYCTNGDFIIEQPENFKQLFALLGDADIMTCGPDTDRSANTAGFIAKTSALKAIMQHMQDHFIPFENYEKYTQEFGNAEGRFGKAIKDLNLKQIKVESPYNDQLHIPGYGTWYKIIGFRHCHGELNYAYRYKGTPPDYKYLDERYLGEHDKKYLKLHDETKDKKVLEDWYAK